MGCVGARDLIILGTGPAGLTAAIYAARANLAPLVVEGREPGGQLMITSDVENYPGFKTGILGPELMAEMREQAARFGSQLTAGNVTEVDLSQRPFRVEIEGEPVYARALIVSTGASAQWLGLEAERQLMGRGVSACATCDGFFFRDKAVVVVGGGDSAMEEALFLTKYATQVTVIHRRDQLRASKIMQERAIKNDRMAFRWNSVVEDIRDPEAGMVTGVILRDVKTDDRSELPCDGVFMAIGHKPNTDLFVGQLEMDELGYVITHDGTKTNVPGVFAAGDVQDRVYRQAVTAAGTGCMAAMDAERFLEAE